MSTHAIGYGLNLTSHLQSSTNVDVVPEQPEQSVHLQFGPHMSCQSSLHGQVAGDYTVGNHRNQQPPQSCSSAMLEFRDISYWLPAPPVSIREWVAGAVRQWPTDSRRLQDAKLKRRHGKQLLLCVNGCAHAGRLLAVMGPSGAGKTTLLSILAGERDVLSASSGRLSGQVLLGGQERHLASFRRTCAHVKQDDMLLPTTTPSEALLFAAALRLPGRSPAAKQARADAVQHMLEGMCLQHCAHTLVGESRDGVKGLSGGERRRLAVAAELLGSPRLALLDEPSSGQDSSTAVQVLSFIKQLITSAGSPGSRSNLSPGVLVITLHQPGREITALLDDLLLLAPGGRPVYMGPWSAALPYFQRHLQLAPPVHTGLAEWYLSLLTSQGLNGSSSSSSSSSNSLSSMSDGGVRGGSTNVGKLGSSNSDSLHTLNLHEAWIAYSTRHHHTSQLLDAYDTYDMHSSRASLLEHVKQEHGIVPIIRVVVGHDTTYICYSVDEGTGTSEIELAEAPPAATAAHSMHDAIRERGAQLDASDLEEGSHSYSAARVGQQQGAAATAASVLQSSRRESASWWVQAYVLAVRNLRYWWRSPAMVMSEAAQYMFVVLFLGSIYPRLPSQGSAAAVDRLAALFMWLVTLLVTAPSRALLSWDMERQLLRHELASGAYGLTPFLVSKLAVGLPMETLMVSVAGSLLYLLLGLQPTGPKYGAFLALNVLCALSAHNFGNLLGLCLPSLHAALPALCVGATLLLSFAGFIVQAVPVWWAWMGETSFCTYAYAGMVRNEFEGLQLHLPASALLSTGGAAGSGLTAATQNLLQAALEAALPGLGSSAANITAMVNAQAQQELVVEGLGLVPATVRVHFGTVQQFIALLLAFTVGSSVMVVASTALLVRLRYR